MAEARSNTRLLIAMIVAIFLYGSIAALLGTLLPDLAERFQASNQALSVMAMIQALGLAISSVAVGPIIDKAGKKVALVTGLAMIAAALMGLALAPSMLFAQGSIFLLGLGGGILVTGANTLVSDVADEKRSSALNLLNLFFGVGSMSTPFLAANIPGLSNSINLCYALAGLAAVTFLLHATTPMPGPTGGGGDAEAPKDAVTSRPELWLLALTLFLYVTCEVGVFNWLIQYLVSQGIETSYAQNVLVFGFAMGIAVGRVVISRVLLGVSEAKVTFYCALAMAATTFGMLQVTSPVAVAAITFMAGLAMAPMFPTTLGMVGNCFPKATGTAMGIAITGGWIGLAVSSYIIGAIADATDLGTALLVLPAASLVIVVVNLALRPYLKTA